MDLEELGRRLRERREALGIKVKALSGRADVGRSTIWAVERGKDPKTGRPPRPAKDRLERWISVLEFTPEEQEALLKLAGYHTAVATPNPWRSSSHVNAAGQSRSATSTSAPTNAVEPPQRRPNVPLRFGFPVRDRNQRLREALSQLDAARETVLQLLSEEEAQ